MEELLMLRHYIEQKDYQNALDLVAELEEMSRDDKINKIYSYAVVLLLHLIKQAAENRLTRSWDLSIRNAVRQIARVNKRRKSGGYYLPELILKEDIADAYLPALEQASLESFEGMYESDELDKMVDRYLLEKKALDLILAEQYQQSQRKRNK